MPLLGSDGPSFGRLLAALTLSVAIIAGGCTRNFSNPKGSRELGQACVAGADCASSVCADSVCCDRDCSGAESCTLPGTLGTCTGRGPGVACDSDSMCLSSFCRDSVCCTTTCGDPCQTCAGPDAGFCHPAADDTDDRTPPSCGPCSACFSGTCAPAFADTDPHQECAAGQSCNGGGACGSEDGNLCASDYTCVSTACVNWICQDASYAHVDDYPFLRTDVHRTPLAVAVGPNGDAAVLVDTDDGPTEDGGYQGSVVAALATSPAGPWIAAHIEYNAFGRRAGAAAFVGDVAYFAVASDIVAGTAEAAEFGYSGVYVTAISSAGLAGGTEYPDPDSTDVLQIALGADARGSLTLATISDGGTLRLEVEKNGQWSDAGVNDIGASGVAIAEANGDSHLFVVAGGQLLLIYADGQSEAADHLPAGCAGPVSAATAPAAVGQQIGLVVNCGGTIYLGVYAPLLDHTSDSDPWRFVAAPADAPYWGIDDDGTGPHYPLSQYLPAGGHGDNVAFSAIEPGGGGVQPTGGYAQLLWMQPDNEIFYSYASPPDNGYSYESFAAAPTPSGASVTAYDTVIDPDGGVTINNSTLLIQSYFP